MKVYTRESTQTGQILGIYTTYEEAVDVDEQEFNYSYMFPGSVPAFGTGHVQTEIGSLWV